MTDNHGMAFRSCFSPSRWDRAIKCDLVLRVGMQALARETLVMMITNLMIMEFAWK